MVDGALEVLRWPAVVALVALSALFAGLTLGMLSLDLIELEVVAAGEDKKLAECARKIIPVRKNGNLLLCTFLVGNTACNSLSSILMADLEGGMLGFAISTLMILIFAEIIPQAVCSRYALQIGARVINIVLFFTILFYPVTKPISLALDYTLGEEIGTIHTRQELSKLLQIHVTEGAIDKESGNILQGALRTLNVMLVPELMTPAQDVYMLHISLTLDFKTVSEIFEIGYSRIPVYDKDKSDVVALLFAKDLILVDPDDETPLQYFISIFGRPVETFTETTSVRNAFVMLRQGCCHLALVKHSATGELLGVVTLEDIVEEIIQEEIVDETDERLGPDGRVVHPQPSRKRTTRSKFQLLNAQNTDAILSSEEVNALARHLLANVKQIAEATPPVDRECLKWILQQSHVMLVEDDQKKIYEKGVLADFCVVVLTGRLEIQLDHEQYRNDAGSLSVVAPEALFAEKFVPDFTATIGTERARIVVIKKSLFEAGRNVYNLTVPKVHSITHSISPTHAMETVVPAAPGADPSVRHAFASHLFSRKQSIKRDSLAPVSPDRPLHRDPGRFLTGLSGASDEESGNLPSHRPPLG